MTPAPDPAKRRKWARSRLRRRLPFQTKEVQDRIRSRRNRFGLYLAGHRTKEGQEFGNASAHVLVWLSSWPTFWLSSHFLHHTCSLESRVGGLASTFRGNEQCQES